MKKRITALILTASLLLTGCDVNNVETDGQQDSLSENTSENPQNITPEKSEENTKQTAEESSGENDAKPVCNVIKMYFSGEELPVHLDVRLLDDTVKYGTENLRDFGFELIYSNRNGFIECDSISAEITDSDCLTMPDENIKTIKKSGIAESGEDKKISFPFHSRGSYSDFSVYSTVTLVMSDIPYRYRISVRVNVDNECITADVDCWEEKAVPTNTETNYKFTEEDRELQSILGELDNVWKIFIELKNNPICEETGKDIKVLLSQSESTYENIYSLLSDKELPFTTIDGMKAEMSKYFTEEAIEIYCRRLGIAKGEIMSENEGIYTVNLTEGTVLGDDGTIFPIPHLLELNGRLYRLQAYAAYLSSIDYSLTRVLKRSENKITFAFIYDSYYDRYTAKGVLKYENGGWKYDWIPDNPGLYSCDGEDLNFYEVWGLPKTVWVPSETETGYEFTDEDIELRGILEELNNAWEIFMRLRNNTVYYEAGSEFLIHMTQDEEDVRHQIILLSDKTLPFTTIDGMKNEMSKYFTENAIDEYFRYMGAARAKILSEENGIYTIEITDEPYIGAAFKDSPMLFEIDGRLYRICADGTGLIGIDYSETRVLSQSSEEISFACILGNGEIKCSAKCVLKYENGSWKYDNCLGEELDFYEVWGAPLN